MIPVGYSHRIHTETNIASPATPEVSNPQSSATSTAQMNYQAQRKAPIAQLTPAQAHATCRQMLSSVPSPARRMIPGSSQDAIRWNNKLSSTKKMLTNHPSVFEQGRTLCYYHRQQPVGLLLLEKNGDNSLKVESLVSHPYTQSVGGSLIEMAATLSHQNKGQGRLTLEPLDEDSRNAYKALGFKGDGAVMTLDPASSDKWQFQNSEWKLRKYIDEKYGY